MDIGGHLLDVIGREPVQNGPVSLSASQLQHTLAQGRDQNGWLLLDFNARTKPFHRKTFKFLIHLYAGAALMAQCVASLADAAPGRFVMGIGTSSDVIVERWNGIPFEQPYQQVRDMVRFLRKALDGEKVDEEFERFTVKGFRSGVKVEQKPPILIAALRQGMLKLAGREGDGAILNWLSADDVKQVTPYVHQGGEGKEIAARIFVLPVADRSMALAIGRHAGTVDEQYHRYVVPQENGNKTDTRWLSLCRKEEAGLLVSAMNPMECRVSHLDGHDLHAARHIHELRPRAETIVELDWHQRGLGTGACGPDTLPQYRVGSGKHRLDVTLGLFDPKRQDPGDLAHELRAAFEKPKAKSRRR